MCSTFFHFVIFSLTILTHVIASGNEFKPYKMYLSNLESGDKTTVFDKAGVNVKNCTRAIDPKTQKEYCTEAVGWPDRDAEITVIGEDKTVIMQDEFKDDWTEEIYVPVEFKYESSVGPKTGRGYIQKNILTFKRFKPIFKDEASISNEICPPKHATVLKKDKKISEVIPEVQKHSKNETFKAIYDLVGNCVTSPPTKYPQNLANGNVFDNLINSDLRHQKIPKIQTFQNHTLEKNDIINIDALARTMYGEIAGCFKRGLQYPFSVARVILNRAENKKRYSEFVDNPQATGKPVLAQVATTPLKFNNWKRSNQGNPNGPLHHSLCPPKTENAPFWRSNQASSQDVEIWKNAVKIATEAILNPKKFKQQTEQLKDIYFYTSGMGSYGKPGVYRKISATIDGRPMDDSKCIELWKENSQQPKKKKRKS